jgi:hypothetical protein
MLLFRQPKWQQSKPGFDDNPTNHHARQHYDGSPKSGLTLKTPNESSYAEERINKDFSSDQDLDFDIAFPLPPISGSAFSPRSDGPIDRAANLVCPSKLEV